MALFSNKYFQLVICMCVSANFTSALAQSFTPTIDTARYYLACKSGVCSIVDSSNNTTYVLPPILLKAAFDTTGAYNSDDDEVGFFPSLAQLIEKPLQAFVINDSIVGLFASSFTYLDRNGTTGMDYIFYLNHKKGKVSESYFTKGLEKFYTRQKSCYVYYILSDMDKDGTVQLGSIKENFHYSMDPLDTTILVQESIKWYKYGKDGYEKNLTSKKLPDTYVEIIVRDTKPNDFLMEKMEGSDWYSRRSRRMIPIKRNLYFTPKHRKE